MISNDLKKRLITSIPLIFLLVLSFKYSYILIISLIILSLISWIEFQKLISKIFNEINNKSKSLIVFINTLALIYLVIFSAVVFLGISMDDFKLCMFYLFSICIFSDVGGLLFGRIFKGRKLTKISPNKTISGSIGSFILSLLLVPIFLLLINDKFSNVFDLIIISLSVSLFCQLGDLFISYLKRKANVKDTGSILPGHGGMLDRIDGIIFAVPLGVFIWNFLVL